ncbi:phosphatase PAP2 family protein [Nocardia mexicana]|uniref:PAP2 superfamily protein n=1 Tax=Nocardia mexicana TaxID=279262 RepID=A0A370H8D9_9NOCA|nr:phosphatase PAP2 family protein [Nocardia mexicana]RDI52676.1 PAP2 superfamily protein [Nocardia mexicana]
MLLDDAHGRPAPPVERVGALQLRVRRYGPAAVWLGIAAAVLVLVAGELMAVHIHALGPLTSLFRDYAGTPKSATTPWAGFLLALVGITWRERAIAVAAAVGLDLAFVIVRAAEGHKFTVGNGPTLVLTALAVLAATRWTGERQRTALRTIALGALLILATKVGDIWLDVTAWATPQVLDPFVQQADRALGNPSWVAGQALDAAGPVVSGILRWVYFELPVAAIVVAVWQLRDVTKGAWPRHYLVRTFLAIGLIGPIFYVIFPVVGPILAYGPEGHGLEVADVWPNIVPPLSNSIDPLSFDGITPRNCMPSLHTAWALSLFIHSRRGPLWLRWGGAFWLAGTLAATLGFGAHYGIDLIVGATLCLTIESVLRDPGRGWDRQRSGLVALGIATFTGVLLCTRYFAAEMAQHPIPFGVALLGVFAGLVTAFYVTWFAPAPAGRV